MARARTNVDLAADAQTKAANCINTGRNVRSHDIVLCLLRCRRLPTSKKAAMQVGSLLVARVSGQIRPVQLLGRARVLPAVTSGQRVTTPTAAQLHRRQVCTVSETSCSRRVLLCKASTSHPAGLPNEAQEVTDRYDRATVRLVTASTVCFGLLLLPQILQNSLALSAGDMASLSILSWVVRPSFLYQLDLLHRRAWTGQRSHS